MNEPRQIATNTFVLAIAKLVDRGSTTVLSLLVARMLGAAGLGVYTAAMVYYNVIFIAASMGATSFVVREVAKSPEHTNRYVVHLSVMTTLASLLAIAVSSAVVPHLGYSADMRHSIYLILAGIIPGALNTIQEATFVAHQRVAFITYTSMIAALANAAITVFLLLRGYGVVSLVASFVIVQYVIAVCYFLFISRFIGRLRFEFSLSEARRLLREIKPFAGSSIISGLLARPEVIILSLLRSEANLGYYSAGIKLADLWAIIPQIYMTNVFPVMSRSLEDRNGKFALIRDKSIKYLLAISLPITAALVAGAPAIVRIIYGRGFEAAVPILRILAWTIPLSSVFSVIWRVLAARGEQERVMQVQVVTSVVRLGAGYPLIAGFAGLGAAVNVSASMLLQNLGLLHYIKRDGTRLPLLQLSWRFAASAGLGGVLGAIACRWIPIWQGAAIGLIAYLLAVFALRAFSPDDFLLFRRIFQPHPASTPGNISTGPPSQNPCTVRYKA